MTKRFVAKNNTGILQSSVGNTQVQTILRTSTERETLIRIVGNVSITKAAGAAATRARLAIVRIANGTAVSSLNTADAGELYAQIDQVLWSQVIMLPVAADADGMLNVHVDVRGMRKLQNGDVIALLGRAILANAFNLAGVLTVMVKKA